LREIVSDFKAPYILCEPPLCHLQEMSSLPSLMQVISEKKIVVGMNQQYAILYEKLKELQPDKETFERIRLILNDIWRKKVQLDPLTLAVYFVYNFNLSYGPAFMGWSSDIYLDETRYKRMIEKIRDFEAKNLQVECADFRGVIKNHPGDFLYCDPPYYIGEGSKMFKGIYPMRNIPVHHNGFPHDILRDLLRNHRGGFILSYNDCPTIREYYREFQQFFPSWQYTMGQGETRIGKNRMENGDNHIKESYEIIVYCPPCDRAKAGIC
ncbi:MAG: DNA adenine methylase, partial [Chloroflexi bacterium]|nr:DNA adenine methylase [Chloroflexota bacterium]